MLASFNPVLKNQIINIPNVTLSSFSNILTYRNSNRNNNINNRNNRNNNNNHNNKNHSFN